jgi:hypothetical protein
MRRASLDKGSAFTSNRSTSSSLILVIPDCQVLQYKNYFTIIPFFASKPKIFQNSFYTDLFSTLFSFLKTPKCRQRLSLRRVRVKLLKILQKLKWRKRLRVHPLVQNLRYLIMNTKIGASCIHYFFFL